jgi:hypothetical protein
VHSLETGKWPDLIDKPNKSTYEHLYKELKLLPCTESLMGLDIDQSLGLGQGRGRGALSNFLSYSSS